MISQQVADQICSTYQLGKLLEFPQIVLGGRVHQVFCLNTEKGKFALKKFNLLRSWGLHSEQEIVEAEDIITSLSENAFPALPAIKANGKPFYKYDDDCYLLFNWIEGQSLSPKEAGLAQIELVGSLLAKLHQAHLEMPAPTICPRPCETKHWVILVQCSRMCDFSGTALLETLGPRLRELSSEVNEAWSRLKSNVVIGHGDLDPWNVIWRSEQDPVIVDWEGVGWTNPMVDLMQSALSWALVEPQELDATRYRAMFKGYAKAGGKIDEDLLDAFHVVMCLWMGWMEYNLERFVGEEQTDFSQQRKSELEAHNALKTVEYLLSLPESSWKYT